MLCDERSVSIKRTCVESADLTRVVLEWNGREWDVASVYVPVNPSKRLTFIQTLTAQLSKKTIIGGDWNCVPDATLDASGRNALHYAALNGQTPLPMPPPSSGRALNRRHARMAAGS